MRSFKKIAAVVLLASMSSFAGIGLTIGGGLNLSNTSESGDYELPSGETQSMVVGFNAGVNALFGFTDKMGLVTGLNYETRGTKITVPASITGLGVSGTETMSASYLQIPVLFSYKFIPELAVNLGPELGFYLSGTEKYEAAGQSQSQDLQNMSSMDFGASIGVSYTIVNMIVVGAGYYLGFLNIDNTSGMSGSVTNNNIKITVAYLLHL